jgi:uncharacterized protein (DUF433 family)
MPLTFEPIAAPLRIDETGTVRVSNTRVTLDTVLGFYHRGETPERIAEGFPTVPLEDIYVIIGYYLSHRPDIDDYLDERRRKGDFWREFWESRYNKQELRERLYARRAKMEAARHAGADHG